MVGAGVHGSRRAKGGNDTIRAAPTGKRIVFFFSWRETMNRAADSDFSSFERKDSAGCGRFGAGLLAWADGGGGFNEKNREDEGAGRRFFARCHVPDPRPWDEDLAVQVGVSIVCTTCLVST
jgi:hypothetical protein